MKEKHEPLLKLTERRQQQNISLRQLGSLCGISYYTIYKYEHGITSPTLEVMGQFAKALNCEVKDLI